MSHDLPFSAIPWHRLPLTRLIHENFAVIMSYAFSTPVLGRWVTEHFDGEWKYLSIALFERPQVRANLALMELATQLRMLDNHEKIPEYWEIYFWTVIKQDKAYPVVPGFSTFSV
jgi:hypothetical protein